MTRITCALAADHRGYTLREHLLKQTQYGSHEVAWLDCGTMSDERTDYPMYAVCAIQAVLTQQASCAVLVCGTGAGMAMAVNRHPHLYAAVAWCPDVARRVREEDNVSCLVLPADYLNRDVALACVEAWIQASFKGGRYESRLRSIDSL